jgi:hypothetical protein
MKTLSSNEIGIFHEYLVRPIIISAITTIILLTIIRERKYYMERNENSEREKTIAQAIVDAWNNLDAEVMEQYLADDLKYSSFWVFQTMQTKEEYLDYFRGKFERLRTIGETINAKIETINGKKVPIIKQSSSDVVVGLSITIKDDKISEMYMMPPDLCN